MIQGRSTHLVLVAVLGLAAAGCSRSRDDLPREPVAGSVTMDGQPLPEAVIQFSPVGDPAKGPTVGANAEIKDGRFSIPREDGLVPGPYKVSISHAELKDVQAKGKVNTSIPSRTKKIGPERIPPRYNANTELKAEIKPGGASDLKYDLQSK
jgi:hypothetical protein